MKGKKLILLTLALLLPVAIFIFLKIFGRNEFKVPPLHEEGTIDAPSNCNFNYATPYRIPDSLIAVLDLRRRDSLYVFYFDPSPSAAMKRVETESKGWPVGMVNTSSFPAGSDLRVIRDCVLLMKSPASVVLVDHDRRIRGYYDGTDRDEVDRLIVEMKIILKQY